MRWFRFLLLAGLLSALMLALWPLARKQIPTGLAGFWRNQILTASDEDAPRLMLELTSLGDDGVRVLVQLVGCQRAAISRAARTLISSEVDRWLRLEPAQAAPRLAYLVKALATEIDEFGPSGKEFAEDLVERLMAASAQGRPLLSGAALPDCERVLQAVAEDHRLRWAKRAGKGDDPERGLPALVDMPAEDTENSNKKLAMADRRDEGKSVAPRPAAEANSAEPARVVPDDSDAESLAPELLDVEPDEMRELPNMPGARPRPKFHQTRLEQPAEVRPAPAKGAEQAKSEEARISVWMHQLHNPDPRIVHHAETHLAEVGFGTVQLELARSLTSPDPLVREQLAEILPSVPGIDAKTWLVWLSRDPRAEVRLAAITVMATINDPLLLKRIQEMARNDPDRHIQEQGQRLVGSRRDARHP